MLRPLKQRQIKLLETLQDGDWYSISALPRGVGNETITDALTRGWVRKGFDEERSIVVYSITSDGLFILDQN
jgi:hypothetical protein